MFNDFFKGKHALVTGVAGTKGVWLALMLLDAGARVTGLDKRLPRKLSAAFPQKPRPWTIGSGETRWHLSIPLLAVSR
jgi:nucleoside-diphosphate-sugar epimerase